MATTDRRAARHAATRRQIVDAAWTLARDEGLQGWALKDLAGAVGMRAPSLYGYFDAKDDIYDAMFADGNRALLDRIATVDRDGTAEVLVRRGARMFFDFCVEDPARHQLLFLRTIPGFQPSPQSYALAVEVVEATVDLLDAAGHGSPEEIDLWTALLTGLATQQVSNDSGGDRWASLLDRAVDTFLVTT